jgi:small subunit ribosomal protein S6
MRTYEELFIIKPDATEEEIDGIVEQVRSLIETGGAVEKVEKWGLRKLAYRVKKQTDGYYVLYQFSSSPEAVKEIERRLRVSDLILKFITVRIDEKLKRIEKRKKRREKRAARKPAPPAPAPQLPVGAEMQAMPGVPETETEKEIMAGTEENPQCIETHGRRQAIAEEAVFPAESLPVLCRKIDDIDYKDVRLLSAFISERGKITPRRITGVCTPHQRRLSEAIKQARSIALVPYAAAT